MVVGCAACLWGCSDAQGQKFSGTGPTITRAFTLESPWEMQWEFTGQALRITVYDDLDQRVLTANQGGSGQGRVRHGEGGTFSLELQTEDTSTWTIRIAPTAP